MFPVRVIPVAAGLMAALLLSACSGTSGNFDPTDWITGEFFDTKTKLPGERKPVFPGGVPGVPEGVPPELVKGNQRSVVEAAAQPEREPAKPARPARPAAAGPAPKPRTASAPPPQPAPTRAAPAARPAQPASADQPTVAWPDPSEAQAPRPAQSTAPAPNWPSPNSQANWPPPDPNSFSR